MEVDMMDRISINLYSDTQTRPSSGMLQAMTEAEVGDDQHRRDPSVNQLCRKTADLLGKQDAVFLPSGTMCNQIALLVHCSPGDEIIADKTAHILNSESGGPAALAGALIRPLEGENGIFNATQVHESVRGSSLHEPRSRLVVVEQTSNRGGGSIWPLDRLKEVREATREHGLMLHMDGARLMNASVASGVAASDYAGNVDSVWLDLTKGLGCPVGAVLAGTEDFIGEAWRWKHRLGGALRQAGVIAAAGIWALENNVNRLAEDHENAKILGWRISDIPGMKVEPFPVQSNLVFFDVSATGRDARELSKELRKQEIWIGAVSQNIMRAVTHLDVSLLQIHQAMDALKALVR